VDAYRGVRHRATAPKGNGPGSGGPVFDWHFGQAAEQLRAKAPLLRTEHFFRRRLEAKAGQLERTQAGWERFVAQLSDGTLWGAQEEVKGLSGFAPGAKVLLDPARPSTAETLYLVVHLRAGHSAGQRAWSELTPEQVFTVFVRPKLDKLPGAVAYDLALVFAELGHPGAQALLDRALLDRGGVSPEDEAWLRRDTAAIRTYTELVQGAPGKKPQPLMREIEAWRRAHLRSDFFLLVDGRPAAEIDQVFTNEEHEAFRRSWGQGSH
jgi:hypothetical protein